MKVGEVREWTTEHSPHWCIYFVVDQNSHWEWTAVVLASNGETAHMWVPGKFFMWDSDDHSILRNSKILE